VVVAVNIVETCKCGASTRIVGSPASLALEVASFRDAHDVCRQPKNYKPRDVTIESTDGTQWQKIGDGPIYVKNVEDDMPCPKCGGDKLRPTFMEDGVLWCHAPSKVVPATERIELPIEDPESVEFIPQHVCPKCGHRETGIPVCDVVVGEDRHYCGCVYRWHSEKRT
jgi:hypothetical protein